MNVILRGLGTLMIALALASCATPMRQSSLETVRVVGVVNQFPRYPNFVSIGTTIFNNEYDVVEDERFRESVSKVVLDYVKTKGFDAREISNDPEATKKVDLVLYLIPRDAYQRTGTFGFGVYQRSLFGMRAPASAYVALNIRPVLRGENMGSAFYRENFSKLQIEQLPEKWASLTDDQKKHVQEVLSNNIQETVLGLVKQVGI